MQNVYIHIGTHKTATTWLQHYLAKNSDKLNDCGFYYPSSGRITQAHHRLGQAIFHRTDSTAALTGVPVWERFKKELSLTRYENILISSEEFEWVARPEVIRDFLPGVSLRVLIYLRRQDDYLESLYGQQVRDFHPRLTKTIHEYLAQTNLDFLDYDALIRRWDAASDQMIVRVFDRKFMANGEIGDDFLGAIGIIPSTRFENPTAAVIEQKASLGLEALEFIRKCNFLNLNAGVHDRLVAQAIELDKIASPTGMKKRQRLLDVSERRELMKMYERGNASVAARYPEASGLTKLFPDIEEGGTVFAQAQNVDRFSVALAASSLVGLS